MTKKRSKVKLSIVVFLTLIGLFLTFFSFVIPTTNTTFKGFINAINYGYDLNGGKLAVYKVYDDSLTGYELDLKVEQTASRLSDSLTDLGFAVTKQNQNIRIEVSKYDAQNVETMLSGYQVDIFDLIGSEKGISFNKDQSNSDAEGSIDGKYIQNCKYEWINTAWCVVIDFNEEGKSLFKDLTEEISSGGEKLYMYVNGSNYNSSGFEIDSSISSLTLTASNQQAAKALALQISVLAKPLILTKIVADDISAGLNTGVGALFGNQAALLVCALVLVVVASFVFLCVRYRILGVLASLAILIFGIIYSFLLQSIPLVALDLSGLLGALVVYLILFQGIIAIFEKIRSEYKSGKRIPNSVTSGFRKNVFSILESYIVMLIFCAVFYLVGSPALAYFAVSLFVGLFVNYFVLFVVLRGLAKIYLPINSTKPKLYNLVREDIKNEI